ncbi:MULTISPECIES: gamma-glutamylcyclotransferase [unclassified Novosphingobium]|uniref:gamma-glutamylcyclotransferase family protein n=1 Tax=unclassified Novosphingobium TaxID=2644732 RepID=UPI0013591EFB|nr:MULTISPECIES: gamma-glutamylcyclotransferase family protein [unclassified Novosphingobium]
MTRPLPLFVYGTLQPHAGTQMSDWLTPRLLRSEPATMPGRLYGIQGGSGWFPALVPAWDSEVVRGTLCMLRLEAGDLALLDRYEGAEYRRVVVEAQTASGGEVSAQVYLWRAALPPGAPLIPGGDFLDWLRTGRRKAFSAS